MTALTSKDVLDGFVARSWRSNAERQRGKGVDFVIGRREGMRLWNLEGTHSVLDCGTGGGVHSLGHRHPEILAALRRALDDGRDTGLWSVPNMEYLLLQDRLAALAPWSGLDRSVITLCSTISVDVAVMFAFRVTGRSRIVAYRHGYHGHTGFAALVTGSPEEGVIEHYKLPAQHSCFFETYGDLDELGRVLTQDVAACILEPMNYETFAPAASQYLKGAAAMCRERGVLFIMDETRTGLGRTGRLWACEASGVEPDMMVVGKGLSGGLYPASALLMREAIYERCMNEHRFAYISSLGGNEISCIVAASVLDVSSRLETLQHASAVGLYLKECLAAVAARHPGALGTIGGHGCILTVGLRGGVSGPELYRTMFAEGVLCHSLSEIDPPSLKLFPPVIMSESEADEVAVALDRAVALVRR